MRARPVEPATVLAPPNQGIHPPFVCLLSFTLRTTSSVSHSAGFPVFDESAARVKHALISESFVVFSCRRVVFTWQLLYSPITPLASSLRIHPDIAVNASYQPCQSAQ